MTGTLPACLATGNVLYYEAFFLGRRFAAEWARRAEATASDAGGHAFAVTFELDPRVVGGGGDLLRARAHLVYDDELRPRSYRSQAGGATFELAFAADAGEVTARLPDASVRQLPLGDARYLITSELVLPWALLFWRAHAEQRLATPASFSLFDAGRLMATPLGVEPAPDLGERWYRTSHHQELELDADGLLVTLRVPRDSVEIRRAPAPPLPAWQDDAVLAVRQPLVYQLPAGATFTLREVTIPGPVTPLGGVLTVPAGTARHPAVVFLAGSGQHDSHGFAGEIDLGTHEVMDALAEAGFLGLRYDTRGAGKTEIGDDLFEQGFQATIADARAALAYVRGLPEVDPRHVFLLGHSQGGVVALVLAAGPPPDPAIGALVLMAAPGRDMGDLLIDQVETQARRLGMPDAAVAAQLAEVTQFVELTRAGTPWVAGQVPDHLVASRTAHRWLLDHLRVNPLELIGRVECPILLLQGEADFQISAAKDAEALRAAAAQTGRDVTLVRLPGLDHLFKPIEGSSDLASYFDRSRRVDRGMLATLVSWLDARMLP